MHVNNLLTQRHNTNIHKTNLIEFLALIARTTCGFGFVSTAAREIGNLFKHCSLSYHLSSLTRTIQHCDP